MMPKDTGTTTAKMNFSDGQRVRANVRCSVNGKKIKKVEKDGREVMIVPSYTMPDNVVMNGLMYPAEEIEKGYKTLESTPAPLSHPMLNGMFVPANSPLGLNMGYFGAWNDKVERRDGRVYVEKVIDIERAKESKMGRRVLEAIEKGDPIHTSTGIYVNVRECRDQELADYEAYDIEFDHDAILLDEEGAATPEQGVGLLVNSSATDWQNNKLQVINSTMDEDFERQLDWIGMELISVIDRKEKASRWADLKSAVLEAIGLNRDKSEADGSEEIEMADENKGLSEVLKALEANTAAITALDGKVDALNTKAEAQDKILAELNADRNKERDSVIADVVANKLLTEEEAKASPTSVLQKMLAANKSDEEGDDDDVTPAPGVKAGFEGNKKGKGYSLAEDWEE